MKCSAADLDGVGFEFLKRLSARHNNPLLDWFQKAPDVIERFAHLRSVMDLLTKQQLSIVTAESCTAGLIAAVLSEAEGASAYQACSVRGQSASKPQSAPDAS